MSREYHSTATPRSVTWMPANSASNMTSHATAPSKHPGFVGFSVDLRFEHAYDQDMSDGLLARLAERDRLDALIAADVAEFDAAQLWDLDAATSMVAWLCDKAR